MSFDLRPPVAAFSVSEPVDGWVLVDGSDSAAPQGAEVTAYRWDFGDGGAAEGRTARHHYGSPGEYCIRLSVTSSLGPCAHSSSECIVVPEPGAGPFIRGDCNGDGEVSGTVTDAVFMLNFNFLGGPSPNCVAACDANGDGAFQGTVTDAVYVLNFNFLGGDPPPAPYPACGEGASPGDLGLGCSRPPASCP